MGVTAMWKNFLASIGLLAVAMMAAPLLHEQRPAKGAPWAQLSRLSLPWLSLPGVGGPLRASARIECGLGLAAFLRPLSDHA